MTAPRKRHELVLVEWLDIVSHSGWRETRDALAFTPLRCQDVGWVLKHDAKCLILVRSRTIDGDIGDVTVIPSGCVTRVHQLERPKRAVKKEGAA